MICEWCSSRFPQNSFSPISFIIPFYSLFHPPLTPISRPSPSSPLIPVFHSHSHSCSLCIHSHLSLPLNHFNHTHSYPFPFQSSHSILFHRSHSHFSIFLLCIPLLSFLRFASTFLNSEINTMFVFILLVALSFVVLIGNTLSQLDVFAFVSDS